MKSILYCILAVICLHSCSKSTSTSCSFNSTSLNGKKFKLTKVINQTDNSDVTTLVLGDPCGNLTNTFTSTTVVFAYGTGCSTPSETNTYTTKVVNGKNIVVVNGGQYETEFLGFDCNSYSIIDNTGSVPLKLTMTAF